MAERFDGKHGWSLRLDGLDGRKNNQARRRGIIIHKGDYVGITACLQNWQEGFRLGRSLGCFVLTPKDYGQLEKKTRPSRVRICLQVRLLSAFLAELITLQDRQPTATVRACYRQALLDFQT